MNTGRYKKIINKIALALVILAAGLLLVGPAVAAIQPGAKYAGGNLTLDAKNATVGELLETIARTAGVDVFITRGFQTSGERMTLKIAGEPLEEVLKSILRGYSYAAIYVKEGDDFRIAAVKIYSEGQQGKEVVPLFSGGRTPVYEEKNRKGETKTVLVSSGDNVVTYGNLQKAGILIPSRMELNVPEGQPAPVNAPWFQLQAQLERQEASRYEELMVLQKRMESADNPEMKKSLSMIYADQLAKFHAMKRVNLNKVESLKRISQLREITGQ
jgi:hypothetical protein